MMNNVLSNNIRQKNDLMYTHTQKEREEKRERNQMIKQMEQYVNNWLIWVKGIQVS